MTWEGCQYFCLPRRRVHVKPTVLTESQVLSEETSELVIPNNPSAKEHQKRDQASQMQALPSLELLGVLWILELRSGTHPSMVH